MESPLPTHTPASHWLELSSAQPVGFGSITLVVKKHDDLWKKEFISAQNSRGRVPQWWEIDGSR